MFTPITKFSNVKRLGCLASAITFASYHQGVVAFFPHVSYFISMPVQYMEGVVHIFSQFFPTVVVGIYFGIFLISVEIIIVIIAEEAPGIVDDGIADDGREPEFYFAIVDLFYPTIVQVTADEVVRVSAGMEGGVAVGERSAAVLHADADVTFLLEGACEIDHVLLGEIEVVAAVVVYNDFTLYVEGAFGPDAATVAYARVSCYQATVDVETSVVGYSATAIYGGSITVDGAVFDGHLAISGVEDGTAVGRGIVSDRTAREGGCADV